MSHWWEPGAEANLPMGQGGHMPTAVRLEAVPDMQGRHSFEPEGAKKPGPHCWQVVLPGLVLAVPAGQSSQEAALVRREKVPGRQGWHEEEPLGANVPGWQA